MNLSAPFIRRPVATTLILVAIALAGAIGFMFLPVSPLPQIEFPTIMVFAGLPGGSPQTMASSVATPLERQFGRIAGITEMTSSSGMGSCSITMQFDLNRNIDAAARDVQAAINAASGQLPKNLPNNPSYRKVNPSDAPILMMALQSDLVPLSKIYDTASSILQQKLAQVDGVGQVTVGGGALPAVRVEIKPAALNSAGLGLEDVRTALAAANANRPKGEITSIDRVWSLSTTDQILKAAEYQPLVIRYKNGAAVRLSDVADVYDGVEDVRTSGLLNGKPGIIIMISRQPGANIIKTVDGIKKIMPQLQALLPPSVKLSVIVDATRTIRASVRDVELTLVISILLVIMVVFLFLGSARATLIPSIAVPVTLVGTFGVMYLLHFSIDNLSLMAMTVATGFVVDDAIVVIENITRHMEAGMKPMEAALKGAEEIGFTILSISLSLVAVFIPILLMGGIVGRLFREFAVTLSIAIGVSLFISLTATPMMCARLLKAHDKEKQARVKKNHFQKIIKAYEKGLRWVFIHKRLTLAATLVTMAATIFLFIKIPKGFFPQQDTGRLTGSIIADQDTSFQAQQRRLAEFIKIVMDDSAVDNCSAFIGGGSVNSGRLMINLKPLEERNASADGVIGRLRGKLNSVPGANLYMQAVQDLRVGGRMGAAQYQYTLRGDDPDDLADWASRVYDKLRTLRDITDVNTDQQNKGLQMNMTIDRPTAMRLGITPKVIDDYLYDAFGQRPVSTMYSTLNQYHVIMEIEPQFWKNPDGLDHIFIPTPNSGMMPLSSCTISEPRTAPLTVNHQGQFPSVTISFNLPKGVALGTAMDAIRKAEAEIRLPSSIRGTFMGTAQAFQSSLANEPILIMAALIAVYIVLGILYESLIHPVTILSTLPSAGVGALLALLLLHTEFSVIALIGIILLIGIVQKNAILMIDFAISAERNEGKKPEEAIFQACLLRFRPIIMTTTATLLSGIPLAIGLGTGGELRRPLGIAIVGGLIFSQMLTLFTTPIVYLYLDGLRTKFTGIRRRLIDRFAPRREET